MTDLITLSQMARQAGIPETSTRRYVEQFQDYFLVRKAGARKLFLTSDIAKLQFISNAFKHGKNRDEIMHKLHEDAMSTTIEAEAHHVSGSASSAAAPTALAESLTQSLAVLPKLLEQKNEIDDLRKNLTLVREALQHEKNRRIELEETIASLYDRVSALESQNEEQTPAEDVTDITPTQNSDDRQFNVERFFLEL